MAMREQQFWTISQDQIPETWFITIIDPSEGEFFLTFIDDEGKSYKTDLIESDVNQYTMDSKLYYGYYRN